MKKFGERNGQCKMNYKTKDQIKEEAFDILNELVMIYLNNTYKIDRIEDIYHDSARKITVQPEYFKDVLIILAENGITDFKTHENIKGQYITIEISNWDFNNKFVDKQYKRLHDCIEDL